MECTCVLKYELDVMFKDRPYISAYSFGGEDKNLNETIYTAIYIY